MSACLNCRIPVLRRISVLQRLALVGISALLLTTPLKAGEWTPLFNGKDLTGWEAGDGKIESWGVNDGMLVCKGGGGGWLSTTKEYGDFELELEFRVPKGGNSGIFLRSPRQGNPAYVGMEIQVLDDTTKTFGPLKPTQFTGSIYDVVAAMPRVTKGPGEWQTMRIVCDKRHVTVDINGTKVVDANLDDHEDRVKEHPGLKREKGYLGLQNHGSGLDYRNLKIRELP